MTFISRTINVVNPKIVAVNTRSELEVESTESRPRSKRALPSSVSTPERSPGAKKLQKVSSEFQRRSSEDEVHRPRAAARKSLGMQFQENVALRQELPAVAIHENEDSLLNIDDIIDPELQSTRVKVLTLWPSGRTDVRALESKDIYPPLPRRFASRCRRFAPTDKLAPLSREPVRRLTSGHTGRFDSILWYSGVPPS